MEYLNKLHRYVDHQRLHIVTKDVISLSISVLLLFRHYISHKITFGAPSSGGVLRSACGAFIELLDDEHGTPISQKNVKCNSPGLALAVDHTSPRGNFVHYDFQILNYISHKMKC